VKVLQVSAFDSGGGAHRIASGLHHGLRARGHESAFAVGTRTTTEAGVVEIPAGLTGRRRRVQAAISRAVKPLARPVPAVRELRRGLRTAHPLGYLQARRRGREFFDYPASRQILDLPPFAPDIVHCHNLHSGYFDLEALAELGSTLPVAMTLHDEWTFTGHCGYSMGCERWRVGCGSCPDLSIYPAIARDATHENWLAKQAIYRASRLYVSAPSRWLLERAQASILADAAASWRLIPNGVDRSLFSPGDRTRARDQLGVPHDRSVLLFAASAAHRNRFKDYPTVAAAAERVAAAMPDQALTLIALGGEGPPTVTDNAELRFVPFVTSPEHVALYYRAADLYLHAANADTFPTTVLEALAVGLPVVATAVGGIGEQIRSLAGAPGARMGASVGPEAATGILVEPHDAAGMAEATTFVLRDAELRRRLGQNAAADAAARFDLERQIDETLAWYGEVVQDWRAWRAVAS
jgi:glycosyltransferase involved in cell wall biosynthesis